jgi:rod shape-determining protein MreC
LNTLSGNTRKPLFQRGSGLGLRAALLLLLSIALLAVDHRTETFDPARNVMSQLLAPITWTSRLPSTVSAIGNYAQTRGELMAENEHLSESLLRLRARTSKVQALEAENQRLRELLSSSEQIEDSVLVAEILATNQDPYRHQIVLNRGTGDGVYRGQAIIDAYGVLGQVVRVLPDTAVGLLITDPDHGVPVEVNRTGLQTVALGRGDGQGLSLPFLPGNADIKVGDLLVSSALGGRFPPGYPVGEVAELLYQPGEHFMEAIAYPTARINQGRQVLLVWSETVQSEPGITETVPAMPAAEGTGVEPKEAAVPTAEQAEPPKPLRPATPNTATAAPGQ